MWGVPGTALWCHGLCLPGAFLGACAWGLPDQAATGLCLANIHAFSLAHSSHGVAPWSPFSATCWAPREALLSPQAPEWPQPLTGSGPVQLLFLQLSWRYLSGWPGAGRGGEERPGLVNCGRPSNRNQYLGYACPQCPPQR